MAKIATRTLDENRRQAKQLMKRILMSFRARLDEELRPRGVTTAHRNEPRFSQQGHASGLAAVCESSKGI